MPELDDYKSGQNKEWKQVCLFFAMEKEQWVRKKQQRQVDRKSGIGQVDNLDMYLLYLI